MTLKFCVYVNSVIIISNIPRQGICLAKRVLQSPCWWTLSFSWDHYDYHQHRGHCALEQLSVVLLRNTKQCSQTNVLHCMKIWTSWIIFISSSLIQWWHMHSGMVFWLSINYSVKLSFVWLPQFQDWLYRVLHNLRHSLVMYENSQAVAYIMYHSQPLEHL